MYLYGRVFKVKHTSQQTEEELNCIVNLGGTVVDVFVWHKVYGKMVAPLNIFSINQVKQFIDGVRSGKSSELMGITDGYHYHTVRGESEEVLEIKLNNSLMVFEAVNRVNLWALRMAIITTQYVVNLKKF